MPLLFSGGNREWFGSNEWYYNIHLVLYWTGRGGRGGRGSYQMDAPRGRFGGRSLGRGGYQDAGDYNRPRGDGYLQRGSR